MKLTSANKIYREKEKIMRAKLAIAANTGRLAKIAGVSYARGFLLGVAEEMKKEPLK